MASHLILLAVVFLMADNCKCSSTDDLIRDYYLRMIFQDSGRALEKRGSPDTTTTAIPPIPGSHKYHPDVFAPMDNSKYDDNQKKKSKRAPIDVSQSYGPEQQEPFGYIAGITRNGPWPCYCKYLI